MSELSITNEDEILSLEYRQAVIANILSQDTFRRKNESLKRHELNRGLSKKWVEDSLKKETLSDDTIALMINRASNISVLRKISTKIAKCYAGGAIRTVEGDEASTKSVEMLSDELDINTVLDRADKYSYFDNNALAYVIPELANVDDEGKSQFKLKLRVLPSYSYDVISDAYYPSKPKAIILSQFPTGATQVEQFIKEGQTGREGSVQSHQDHLSRGKTLEQSNWRAIWWTDKYHFTTDIEGRIIPPSTPNPEMDGLNPIGTLPFIPIVTEAQDECYWVTGGNDLVDGDLWINKTLTDLSTIAYVQGWGQPVMTGKDLPKVVHAGPNKCIMLEQKSNDEPTPQFFFAQASPDITSWLSFIEQYTALLLSTRNLSPRNVSAKLDATNVASGIALLIEKSESTDDVKNKQREFQDKEPLIWEVIRRWHSLYFDAKLLVPDFMEIAPIKDSNVKVKFLPISVPVTEGEVLDNLKKRSDLGIATLKDLIMLDNSDLSEEEAEAKVAELEAEKKANMAAFGVPQEGDDEADIKAAFGNEGEEEQEPAKDA